MHTSWEDKIQQSVRADGKLQALIEVLKENPDYKPHYALRNGFLTRKGRLVVGNDRELRLELLSFFHASSIGGHSGVHATTQRVSKVVYWKGMQSDVRNMVRECHICQQCKYDTVATPGLLQPLEIPNRFWEVISMDFIEGLPKALGHNTILVVVDKLSKFGHFIALKHPYSAGVVAQSFMEHIAKLYGMPSKIISDRDPIFLSNFWKELFKAHQTELAYSTAYHPQTDGQTEVLNRCLETYLRCFTLDAPSTWVRWLPLAQFWYNTSHHSSLGMSPYQALFGQTPPNYVHYHHKDSANQVVDTLLMTREATMQQLRSNLTKARQRMKIQADKNRSEREFEVGDWVYLKLQPYKQQSVNNRAFHKLAARYYGHFKIMQRIGKVAYQLQLPASSKIHDVFHVSLLKKSLGDHVITNNLPPVADNGEIQPIPLKILDRRLVNRKNRAVSEVLVQWSNTDIEDSTWELYEDLTKRFPEFDVWAHYHP